jgi:formylglycine-generating enzyme required for sulfatase activity
LPTHAVTLAAFYLAVTPTTWGDWVAVRNWAVAHGYPDLASVGAGKADMHPVQMVSWYEVVKWCNAKSEKEGLVPVYYSNDAQTTVYRTGSVDVTLAQVKWTASGYRLPTEAEREYAARGGLAGKRFPWGDTITHSQANYYSDASYSYDLSPTRGFNPTYATGFSPYTSPVGGFAANGYGLFDMAGNVFEWNWDWAGIYSSVAQTDPRGDASGSVRAFRGGASGTTPNRLRSADRGVDVPGYRSLFLGFRPARSSVP